MDMRGKARASVLKKVRHAGRLVRNENINLLENLEKAGMNCTSCEICANVCSFGALSMVEDRLGFLQPSINHETCTKCRRCEKVCPPLNVSNSNTDRPECYAFAASESECQSSASGGLFAVLAQIVLKDGGHVFGASWNQDYTRAELVEVTSVSELHKLRGSKYVQSVSGLIYQRVQALLEEGQRVLFAALPCQVAALRSFLRHDYEKLLLVDLFCHSAPSPLMLKTYLDEQCQGRRIVELSFRPVEMPWGQYATKIVFDDGASTLTPVANDSFLRGYFATLYSKESCSNCQFQEPPRQGDISIGDFWGIGELYPNWDTRQGVSIALLNNEKGRNAFASVQAQATSQQVCLDFVFTHNRLRRTRKTHLAKTRFLDELLPNMSFSRAVDMALGWKFDVAISGAWCVLNYGGGLTYYALYNVCRDMGFHPIMVESYRYPKMPTATSKLFRNQPYPFYNVSRVHDSFEHMKELNKRVTNFLLGSDQAWNHSIPSFSMPRSGLAYSFGYAAPWRKRIAYSTSFGSVRYLGDVENRALFASEIKKFDYISVRENAGIDICKNEFGVDAVKMIDPVFLCDRQYYETLAESSQLEFKKPTLVSYFIWPDEVRATPRALRRICKYAGAELFAIGDARFARERAKDSMYPYEDNVRAEDWLYSFMQADTVITDSFHAICFSIIFKKRFVFIQSEDAHTGAGLDRILDILNDTGLQDRLVKGIDAVIESSKLLAPINYDQVYKRIQPLQEEGLTWLRNALEAPKEYS